MDFLKSISFNKLKIFIFSIFIIFIFLFTSLIVYEEYIESKKDIETFKKEYLKKQKDLIKKETLRAIKYISYKHKKDKNRPLEELKKEIIDAIEYMRDERDGTGYIFIYTFDGVNIADPILKQNKGKNLINFTDPNGKKVIKELIEVSKKPDGGYVEYVWNKPIVNILAPKISYAKAYEPFKWMIGTGVYLDDIKKIIQKKEQAYKDKMIKYIINIITLSFILLIITLAITKYLSSILEKSLLKIKIRFNEAANKNIYIYTDDILIEEFKEIARYANRMIKIIKDRTQKLKDLNKTLEIKVLQKTKKLHKQNEELKKSKEFTESILKMQDKFLKTAIHEINTPLSIILTNIDLLKMENIENKELTNIESGIKIIHNIYNDLEYMVKKDRVEYKREWIDFSSLLKERVEFFKEIAKGNMLNFNIDIKENIKIFINSIELQRVIDNNLSNAIKYSYPKNTIFIKLYKNQNIFFKVLTKSNKIKDKDSIFKQFYKEDDAKGGFGLGLSLVKEICDKYNYKIELEYKDGYNIFTYIMREK